MNRIPASLRDLRRRIHAGADALFAAQTRVHHRPMAQYEGKPALYAERELGITLCPALAEVLESVEKFPYRTNIRSGHKIGKTHFLAALINYWFDVYDPGVVITSGASWDAMCDTVWSEVRMQRTRAGRPDFWAGPIAPWLRSSPEHWAKLFSVNRPEVFQGKHRSRILLLFDETVGVDKAMFTVGDSIFKPEPGFAWVCCCNPTDPSSHIYAEEQLVRHGGGPKWRTVSLSALDHPNIVKQRQARAEGIELYSRDLPVPNAVSITQIDDWVLDWCLPIDPASRTESDFEWIWRDGTRSWHRPQMDWEARCMGIWPTSATSAVWSLYLFELVMAKAADVPLHLLPEVGGDVARFGDDKSCIHTRWGPLSLGHARRQGLRTTEMAGWLIETANDLAALVNRERAKEGLRRPIATGREIALKVDDDGVGGGVVDILFEEGFNVIPVGAGSTPFEPARYLNKRSELWFSTVKRAQTGGIACCSIGADGGKSCRLDTDTVARLKLQALAPHWHMGRKGHRVVEEKKDTKARLGYSPDDMDAFNLAYYEAGWEAPEAIAVPAYDDRQPGPTRDDARNDQLPNQRPRRRLFGR